MLAGAWNGTTTVNCMIIGFHNAALNSLITSCYKINLTPIGPIGGKFNCLRHPLLNITAIGYSYHLCFLLPFSKDFYTEGATFIIVQICSWVGDKLYLLLRLSIFSMKIYACVGLVTFSIQDINLLQSIKSIIIHIWYKWPSDWN